MPEPYEYLHGSVPSAHADARSTGGCAGLRFSERKSLARMIVVGLSRQELAAVVMVRFAGLSKPTVCRQMRITAKHLRELLASFDHRAELIERRQARELALKNAGLRQRNARPIRMRCGECGAFNQILPGDPTICQECLAPLKKESRGQAAATKAAIDRGQSAREKQTASEGSKND